MKFRRFELTLFHLISLSITSLFLVMFIWVVSASLRTPAQPPSPVIELIPQPISWSNYNQIFDLIPLGQYTLNSIVVAGIAVPVTVVIASWAGFAMAQQTRRRQRQFVLLSIILLLVPITALWLTRYLLFTQLGIVDTLLALVVPSFMGTNPLFILLFYWAFRRIPMELYEASQLEGAGALRVWGEIVLPMVTPTVTAVTVLAFITYWSDFINPLLYLKTEDRYTLAVGLQVLQQLDRTNWSLLMAACVVMTAPTILLFLFAQRQLLWPEKFLGSNLY